MSRSLDIARREIPVDVADEGTLRPPARVVAAPLLRFVLILNVVALPILVPRGPLNTVPADLPAIVLIMLGAAALQGARAPIRLPLGLSYTLIVVGGLLGTAQSLFPAVAVAALLVDVYIYAWFVVLVDSMILLGRGAIRAVTTAWVWTAALIGLIGSVALRLGHERVPTLLGYDFVDRWERFSGTFRDPNMAGSYLVLSLFVIAASPWPRRWWMKLVVCVPILVAIQATRSNTALFALAAGVGVALVLKMVSSRRTALGLTFGLAACALLIVAIRPSWFVDAPAHIARSLGDTEAFEGSLGRFDSSLGTRLNRIGESLSLFGPQILVGIGPSTSNETLFVMDADVQGELHNDYVAALVERGIIGAIGLFALMSMALRAAATFGWRSRTTREGWVTPALAGGVTAVITIGMALESLHFRHVWMFFAIVFALSLSEVGHETPDVVDA